MTDKNRIAVHDIAVFAMLGAVMFVSKKLMEFIPNVHPLTMLTMVYTLVYRRKAIYPLIVYLALETALAGGITWIVPYYYIFPLVWLCTLALPKKMRPPVSAVVYCAVCTAFGLLFGTLYAPWQAIMYGLDFHKTILWIGAGLPYDALHAGGNFAASLLIIPLVSFIRRIDKTVGRQ